MRLADGVDVHDVHPVLWSYLGAIAREARVWHLTEAGLVVTSLRRPAGPRPSVHSPEDGGPVRAADLRRHAFPGDHAERFCNHLQSLFGPELGVVLEPEWLTPEQIAERGGLAHVEPHIHVQLKGLGMRFL